MRTAFFTCGLYGLLLLCFAFFSVNPASAQVAHWTLDESSGTTAADSSGNSHDATATGGVTVGSTGIVNSAFTFDGTNDVLTATGYKGVVGTGSRTMSAWIKTTDDNGAIINYGSNASDGQKWIFRVQDTNGPAGTIRLEVEGGYIVGSTAVNDGQWHHVAAVLTDDGSPDVSEIVLYVDGAAETVGASSARAINTVASSDVLIGNDLSNRYFDGAIDDVRIYDTALTAQQVSDLYNVINIPIGVNDTYSMSQDSVLTVLASGVLTNDTDANGDSLTATLVSNGSNGSVTLNSDGSFTYTPNAAFVGADTFTYKANDGSDDSNAATVTITVKANGTNNAPAGVADNYTVYQGAALSQSAAGVLANDTDADGDSLRATLVSNATNGLVTLNLDGSFTYIADATFTGADSFTYRATDGIDNTNVTTVNITVNTLTSPVAHWTLDETSGTTAADASGNGHDATASGGVTVGVAGKIGTAFSFDGTNDELTATGYKGVTGTASRTMTAWVKTTDTEGAFISYGNNNSDGNKWIFRVQNNNGPSGTIRLEVEGGYIVGTTPIHDDEWHHVAAVLTDDGSPNVDEIKLYVDGSLETISQSSSRAINTPSDEDVQIGNGINDRHLNGSLDDLRIYDQALTAEEIASLAVANTTPSATAQSPAVTEDVATAITLTGTDSDGDSLTYTVVSNPSNGTLSGTAPNLTYTPIGNFNGNDSFTFKVNDGNVASAVATVTITVSAVNDAPVATADTTYTLAGNTALTQAAPGVLANDTDVENNTLIAIKVTDPTNGSVMLNADGSFTYTPNTGFTGTDSFTYKANDGALDSNTATATINVTDTVYSVTFDLGTNGSLGSGAALVQTIVTGQAATAPTVIANDGWIFTGWDSTFSMITNNVAITAQYTRGLTATQVTGLQAATTTTFSSNADVQQLTANLATWTGLTLTTANIENLIEVINNLYNATNSTHIEIQDIDSLTDSVSALTTKVNDDDNLPFTAEHIQTFIKAIKTNSQKGNQAESAINESFDTLNTLLEAIKDTTEPEQVTLTPEWQDAFFEVKTNHRLLVTEQSIVTKGNFDVITKSITLPTTNGETVLEWADQGVEITLPHTLPQATFRLQYSRINGNPHIAETTQTLLSNVWQLSLYDMTTNEEIDINNLTDAIAVSLDYSGAGALPVDRAIRYFDEDLKMWLSIGISNVTTNGNTITFHTDHLTDFGLFSLSGNNGGGGCLIQQLR